MRLVHTFALIVITLLNEGLASSDVEIQCNQDERIDFSTLSPGIRVIFKSHNEAGKTEYSPNTQCNYKMRRGNFCKKVHFTCSTFDLAKSEAGRCQSETDFLLIDGGNPTLNRRYCSGQNPDFMTDWSVLDVSFQSDESKAGLGFICQAVCTKFGEHPDEDQVQNVPNKRDMIEYANTLECGNTFDVSTLSQGQRVKFMSHPEFKISNYPDNFDCKYQIKRGSMCQEMRVQCMDFKLTTQSAILGVCQFEGDYLNFNGGPNSIMDKRYCADLKPNFTTSWHELNVHFHSDYHINSRGFECVLECISYKAPTKRSRGTSIRFIPCASTVDLAEYPHGETVTLKNHPQNDRCDFEVKLGDMCSRAEVVCSESMASDCSEKLEIRTNQNGQEKFCGKDIPTSTNVTDKTFQVSVTRNLLDQGQSFQCKVKCTEERMAMDKRSGVQGYEVTPCGAVENLSDRAFGEPVRMKSHPGFDGTSHYEDSTDCRFTFKMGEVCKEMTIQCPSFKLFGDDTICMDKVTIVEDESKPDKVFCGSNAPSVITTSPTVRFNFFSDDTVTDLGFECLAFCSGKVEQAHELISSDGNIAGSKAKRGDVEENKCECGQRNLLMRIISGSVTQQHEFPWQAGLVKTSEIQSGSFRPFCGGTLMNDQWVFTAAHCTDRHRYEPELLSVVLGEHDVTDRDESVLFISSAKEIIIHESYKRRWVDYDFSLIKLKKRIVFNNMNWYIRPICYPKQFPINPTRKAIVTGWGAMKSGDYANALNKVEVDIFNSTVCDERSHSLYTERMFCAGIDKGDKDSCQ
ncbi:hypothetical protein TCAL_02555, partial [Tigriopus californicus]